jgi:hypothetical protein
MFRHSERLIFHRHLSSKRVLFKAIIPARSGYEHQEMGGGPTPTDQK